MDHQLIPYNEQLLADMKAEACAPQTIDGVTRYSVVCQACFGPFTVDSYDGYRASIFRKRTVQPAGPISVICECGFDHPSADKNEFVGCGAGWWLTQ